MLMQSLPRSRRGISLIEILVVISIIGVLTAISVGTVFRLRAVQDESNTEATLSKLHSLLQTRWSAVLDDAKKTVPEDLVQGLASGDKDRARVIWTYAKLQNEFPQTFVEARRTINFGGAAILRPRRNFETIANDPGNTSLSPEMQSCLLICAALLDTGTAGNAAGLDGIQNQVITRNPDGTGGRVIKDSWGTPIHFIRHATSPEINAEPYARPTTIRIPGTNNNFVILNPFDPLGKFIRWGTTPEGNLWANETGTTMNPSNRQRVMTILGFDPRPNNNYQRPNVNEIPTLISAGKNKLIGDFSTMLESATDADADNILSYRLRREGDRGN